MHSISDLTTFCRKTTGDVPSRLVGASTTVVGSKMYLFGGRLVSERRMAADLYVFDLVTFHWEKILVPPEDEVPRARYFHSADTWNNQLIIFGGMSNKFDSPNPDDLCVLNDVRFFDLVTRRWMPSSSSNRGVPDAASDSLVPRARYAHLSSVTADRLFIIGGQDFFNVWLDDVYIYDLFGKAWVQRRDYPRHCGTYRSVAVSGDLRVRLPQEELRSQTPSKIGPPGARFRADKVPPSKREFTSSESLVNLPYSTAPSEEYPSDIYLYSNYNFTDVKRELEVFSPLPDSGFTIHDRSSFMSGYSFPPGLRFPTGAILGTHFIVAGTYLAHTYQSFSIWALDLVTMTWSRIDPGSAVSTGSWFRGCLWAESNKFLIFGNRHGNLVDDYNRRLLSWDHVAIVDLEAFGIYQPPALKLDIPMQQLGLAALEESVLTDFEVICDDGRKIACSRKILEERWPWFKEQRRRFSQTASRALESLPASPTHVGLPELPGTAATDDARPDPRLTPRAFQLSEPYPITLALLQYFYSLALITPLQHAPPVLSQLLILSNTYQIIHLESLVKHAMHRALSNSTSVGVYEVATLCSCRSLQIRALKTVMSYSQKRPPGRSRDKENGNGGSRPPDGSSKPTGGGSGESSSTSRPRGASDAPLRNEQHGDIVGSSRGYTTKNGPPTDEQLMARQSADLDLDPLMTSSRPTSHKHNRSVSVVSISTDNELVAVAELMSPTVVGMPYIAEERVEEQFVRADSALGETTDRLRASREFEDHDRLSASSSLMDTSSYLPPSPSAQSTYFSESEADPSSDDHDDPAYPPMPATSSYVAFHLPRPRPRLSHISASDSDTPSLSSSASYSSLASASRSAHRRSSPITPMTPDFVPVAAPHLSIIEERHPEDPEITHNLSLNLADDIKTPALPSDQYVSQRLTATMQEPLKVFQTTWAKKKIPHLGRSSEPTSPLLSPEPSPRLSPTLSYSGSRTASPNPSTPVTITRALASPAFLSRFTSPSKKDTKTKMGNENYRKQSSSVSLDSKSQKTEDKKAKKAEAKARTEALALELKIRARERADADKGSIHSSRSSNRDKLRMLDDRTALYGGLMGV